MRMPPGMGNRYYNRASNALAGRTVIFLLSVSLSKYQILLNFGVLH